MEQVRAVVEMAEAPALSVLGVSDGAGLGNERADPEHTQLCDFGVFGSSASVLGDKI